MQRSIPRIAYCLPPDRTRPAAPPRTFHPRPRLLRSGTKPLQQLLLPRLLPRRTALRRNPRPPVGQRGTAATTTATCSPAAATADAHAPDRRH